MQEYDGKNLYEEFHKRMSPLDYQFVTRGKKSEWTSATYFDVGMYNLLGAQGVMYQNVKEGIKLLETCIKIAGTGKPQGGIFPRAPLAAYVLGDVYLNGRFNNVAKNLKNAEYYYDWAANHGHGESARILGNCYYFGENGFEKNLSKAAHYFKCGYEKGNQHPGSSYLYGFMILHNQGGLPQDYKLVVEVWKHAIRGHSVTETMLKQIYRTTADFYENGKGNVPQDKRQAWVNWWALAGMEDALAQFKTGEGCYNGTTTIDGINTDIQYRETQALQWFVKAEAQGECNATAYLGTMHCLGKGGLQENIREALRLFELAAERGSALGAFNAGILHEKGQARGVNYNDALKYYQRAKLLGYQTADASIRRVEAHIMQAKALEQQKEIAATKAVNLSATVNQPVARVSGVNKSESRDLYANTGEM
jgi:TPR repeat protein